MSYMNDARKEVHSKEVCKDCGHEFVITVGEADFFTQNGMTLPKRCYKCRQAKKKNGGTHGQRR